MHFFISDVEQQNCTTSNLSRNAGTFPFLRVLIPSGALTKIVTSSVLLQQLKHVPPYPYSLL